MQFTSLMFYGIIILILMNDVCLLLMQVRYVKTYRGDIMPMPGAGDSYFYEWYVGLENVIKMLNPDSGIRCVIFQHDEYDTVDDVVVENTDGDIQMCYQVKHNIETAEPRSLTFGTMIEVSKGKKCLFEAMFHGWKQACAISNSLIKPVLFTNRKIYNRRAGRYFNSNSK